MAVINKQIAYMALPLSIRRGNPFPIDEYSVWYDKAAMENYAQTSPVAYVGQILSLVNETESTVEAYMIQNTAGALVKLAATTSSGDLTEDILELQGKVSNLETSVGTKGEESTVTATDLWSAIDEVVAAYIAADAVIDGKFANYYNKTETDGKIDEKVSVAISSTYKPAGIIAFESLPALAATEEGKVYNVSNAFTTTENFVEGTGKSYPAGTNVVCIDVGENEFKWDVLSGFVDLSAYATTASVTEALGNKVDKVAGSSLVPDADITKLQGLANIKTVEEGELNLSEEGELSVVAIDQSKVTGLAGALAGKVNVEAGKSGMEIILPDSAINTPYQLILSEEVTQPALSSCTNLIINRGNSLIEIKWKDPDNIVSDNAATSEWKYTKVIRKINSQPVDINDGTEVVLSSIKNQYAENGFIDLDVDNEKEYYYGFFAINNDDISDSGAFIKADKYQPSSNKGVFGVSWDTTNSSSELTRLTIDTDPNHFVTVNIDTEPVPAVGTGEGSSPFDNYLPWMGMEEYNIVNGEILYKQGEEGFSRSSYDTMVYIPEFWYYIERIQDNVRFYISSEPRENFSKHPGSNKYISRYEIIENNGTYMSISGYSPKVSINIGTMRTNCASKGNGWQQDDFMCYQARNLLYLVEFANFNSQNMLGTGISGDSAAHNTGETDAMIYHTGRAEGTNNLSAVQYRHIENPYGNVHTFVDGILINEHEVFLCTDPQYYGNEITENYLSTGITTPDSNGYPKDLIFSDSYSWALIPSKLGGSTSTYLCDYYYQDSGLRILFVGGGWNYGVSAGFWYFHARQAASWSSSSVGGRSVFIKQNSN